MSTRVLGSRGRSGRGTRRRGSEDFGGRASRGPGTTGAAGHHPFRRLRSRPREGGRGRTQGSGAPGAARGRRR